MRVEDVLNTFGKRVIQQSRTNLTKKKKNFSKGLYNSLAYKLDISSNKYTVSFEMEDYGSFVDRGVKGAGGVRRSTSKFKRTNNKGKLWKLKKVTNNDFKFGKSGGISPKHFTKWARSKGLSPFAVAKSVYHTGLETTNFFTRPLENEFNKLPDELLRGFAGEIDLII